MFLASLLLAALPFMHAAGSHSQHVRVTASVQVTRPCRASFSNDHRVVFQGDCEVRDDGETMRRNTFAGDQDNRRIYRIDRDNAAGVTTIQF